LWQLVQLAEVAMWLVPLPVACVLLWQVAQVVDDVKVLWSTLPAGNQAAVLWQLSQDAVVGMWVADLPVAVLVLWHEAQVPAGIPVWFILAPTKVRVVWQVSQLNWVGTCCAFLTTLPRDKTRPVRWQLAQSLGVPLKTPLTWQDSHRALLCSPDSAKPVCRWSKLRALPWAKAALPKAISAMANSHLMMLCIREEF
jgi:hypothetical protein